MNDAATELAGVEIVNRSISVASTETQIRFQKLSVERNWNNPGGNFDISAVSVLPGVGGTAGSVGGFRNDLIRGGPNENVFTSTESKFR
jgi:hypothetical protein